MQVAIQVAVQVGVAFGLGLTLMLDHNLSGLDGVGMTSSVVEAPEPIMTTTCSASGWPV